MHAIAVRRVGDRWVRWILIRDPDTPFRRYWNGRKWVRRLRNARLYDHLGVVLEDIGLACAKT
jgi:hypothetical protein